MGVSNSKAETCEALRLCKERKKFIKQAIDSRYNLAAAHVVYLQSLRNIGIALRKFAESEFPLDSSSKNPPPSPPQMDGNAAPGGGGGQSGSPPVAMKLNYMKSSGAAAVTVNLDPSKISNHNKIYVDDVESLSFTMSPPPPPPPPSWDYFHPRDGSFRFMGHDGFQVNFNDTNDLEKFTNKDADLEGFVTPPESMKKDETENDRNGHRGGDLVATRLPEIDNETNLVCKNGRMEELDSKDGCLTEEEETEDPSEFITHRAKDFLSSIKEIENYFFRASKSGNEVSRMLEANKIQISYSETKGSSTASSSNLLTCFRGETASFLQEPPHAPKVVTWKRSTSSRSSPSNPSDTPSNDDNNENNFVEEFCMIAGRHSSTLDRLYAWERKLYDEVKASEYIRKEYDQTCDQLRHQFAKDLKPHVMDKTRAVAKDLHSRMRVALHTVDSISKRIEKMRDDELQPQLVELIQGLIRMWKSMLECHHAQYITSSLAYHSNISKKTVTHHNESKNQITNDLHHEIESFGSSFSDLVNSYSSYIESINGWLNNCIIQPKERLKNRRAFSPRRAVAPPIFVICRDWSTGFRNLPSQKLGDSIKDLLAQIRRLSVEELENKRILVIENGEEMKNGGDVRVSNLSGIHSGLTKVFDRLTKFSEGSLKMYEDMKQNSETFGNVYSNYRAPPRAYSI